MTSLTMNYTGTLAIETCGVCGITFALPEALKKHAWRDHDVWFWCPLGHKLHYLGETDEQRLQKQLDQEKRYRGWAETRAASLRDQLDSTERSRAALKGHLTRARNKIANGVCPVGNCRRHFDNVQAHIASEHPTWHVTDPETGKAAVL